VTGKLEADKANTVPLRGLNRNAAGDIFGKVGLAAPTGEKKTAD